MSLWFVIPLALIVGWMLWSKFRFSVGRAEAIDLINKGALILDVRTPAEFSVNRLPGAINLPTSDIADEIQTMEPDKDRPILCHCVSGARSAMAVGSLRKMGYTQVFNLGSYRHAASIVWAAGAGGE